MDELTEREVAIFNDARRLAGPERVAYLDQACAGDDAFRQRLDELLRVEEPAGDFLEKPAYADRAAAAIPGTIRLSAALSEKPGDRIGRYKLLEQIGEGGCGVVYMAEQQEPVRRRVALKVIKLGMDTRQVVARFEAERQALALMDHPNIAKVFDAGATETGRPYFVMELVRGVKITDYCDHNSLPIKDRLALFIQVCKAIQHAHQTGIIHRDIKPSNILVTLHDGVAVPKVIDFGIAKAAQGRLPDLTLFTAFEQFMGTPAYTSPEQAEIGGLDIDTRSDIYSLGVLLYELLTGKTPFDKHQLLAAGLDAMRRTIREHEPERPSSKLSTMLEGELTATARRLHTEAPKLVSSIRGDLDWIVMKCLEKERSRRYETANGLATDIERHLAQKPVTAFPPSKAYLLQKLIRRNKLVFAAAAVALLGLVLGLGLSTWQFLGEKQARQSAAAAERLARDAEARQAEASIEAKLNLSGADFLEAIHLAEEGNKVDALAYLSRSLALNPTNEAALTRMGTLLVYNPWMPPRLAVRQNGIMRSAQFSPDGQRIVTASDDGIARVWDAWTGKPLTEEMKHGGGVRMAQFSPDGGRVATAASDGTARVWDAQTGRPLTGPLKQARDVVDVQFSPDGKRVVTASDDGSARVWDAGTGQPVGGPLEHGHWQWVRTARFSADGKRVVTASKDGTARIWDALSGQASAIQLMHSTEVFCAQFSPDGRRVITCAGDGARLWDAQTGRQLAGPLKHSLSVRTAQFSSDGQKVVTASDDGTARVWDASTGQPLTPLLKHIGDVRSAEFSPNGEQVLTGSMDGTARLWSSQTGQPLTPPLRHGGFVRTARFSPDGKRVLTASDDGRARIWGPRTQQPIHVPFEHAGGVLWAQFSPDGTRVVTASADGTARVWDSRTGRPTSAAMQHCDTVCSAQFSPDGARVVTASSDCTARVWDARTGLPVTEPLAHDDVVVWAQFSPDGNRVVTASRDDSARVWDAQSGRPLTPPLEHAGAVSSAQFSPDGQRVVTASEDNTTRVWNAHTGRSEGGPLKHNGWVESTQFSPDGTRLLTSSRDGKERIWNVATGDLLLERYGPFVLAQFSSDGKRIVTASDNGTARVWDAQSWQPLTPAMQHAASVVFAQFSPDGKRIITASLDGSARVWDANSGLPLTEPLKQDGPVRHAQFSPDGTSVVTSSDDGTAVVWYIGPSGEQAPKWLLPLAEALCGERLTKASVIEQFRQDPEDIVVKTLSELNRAPADNQWAEWGRWFLADPSTRTISPYSKVSVADYMQNRLGKKEE